jgi:hypothetical protein
MWINCQKIHRNFARIIYYMNLESQVCSLDLAKRLKELGVKQESLFYHCLNVKTFSEKDIEPHLIAMVRSGSEYYSAFSVAELGFLLPNKIVIENNGIYRLKMNKYMFIWALTYKCTFSNIISSCDLYFPLILIKNILDKNEANCRARMLIYLIENGLVKAEDINDA